VYWGVEHFSPTSNAAIGQKMGFCRRLTRQNGRTTAMAAGYTDSGPSWLEQLSAYTRKGRP